MVIIIFHGMAKPTQNIIHAIDTATAPTDKQETTQQDISHRIVDTRQ